jgi:hypothetical protein
MIFATQIKNLWEDFRKKGIFRANTATCDIYVGSPAEIIVDTEANNLRIMDGATPGGITQIPNISQVQDLTNLDNAIVVGPLILL